jgi:hypothetical protein
MKRVDHGVNMSEGNINIPRTIWSKVASVPVELLAVSKAIQP